MDKLSSCNKQFLNRINEIKKHIEMTRLQNDLLNDIYYLVKNDEQKEYIHYLKSLNTSTIQYNAIIISLYGCFENYIVDLLSCYTDIMFKYTGHYNDLPKSVKEKYTCKIGEYLTSPNKFSSLDLNVNSVINNFSNILCSNFDGNLNKEFLLAHSGNLKSGQIFKLLHDFSIISNDDEVYQSASLKNYHLNIRGLDEDSYKIKVKRKSNDLFEPLNELIDKRNAVAHSWSIDNRISVHNLITYTIPFLKHLSETILRLLFIKVFEYINEYSFEQRKPIAVYNKHILCINSQKNEIHKGDYVFYKNKHGKVICSKILKIEVENKEVENVTGKSIDIGIELDCHIKDTDEICYCFNNS